MNDLAQTISRGTDQMSEAYAGLARVRSTNRARKAAAIRAATESLGDAARAWKQYGDWKDAKASEDDVKAAMEAARLGRVKGGADGVLTAMDGHHPSTVAGYAAATAQRKAALEEGEELADRKYQEVQALHLTAQTEDLATKAKIRARQQEARATLGAREKRSSILPGYQTDPIDQEQFFIQQGVEVPDDVAAAAKEYRLAQGQDSRDENYKARLELDQRKADEAAQAKRDKLTSETEQKELDRAFKENQAVLDRGLAIDKMKAEEAWRQAQLDLRANAASEDEYENDLKARHDVMTEWIGQMNGKRAALNERANLAISVIRANRTFAAQAKARSEPDTEFVSRADAAQKTLDAVNKEMERLDAAAPPEAPVPKRGAKKALPRLGATQGDATGHPSGASPAEVKELEAAGMTWDEASKGWIAK